MPSHPLKNRYRQLSIPERDKLTYYTISYTSIWFFLVPNSSLTSKQWTFKSWLDLWHLLYVFSSSKLSTSNYHSTNNSQTDWLLHQCAENNLKQTVGIKICNTKKEDAGFTFLGRIVGISEFAKKIINKGERRLNKLLPFWDQCEEAGRWEQLSTKLRMFNSKVKSVLQYESGTWRETLITSMHGIYWGKQTPISQSKP